METTCPVKAAVLETAGVKSPWRSGYYNSEAGSRQLTQL